MRKIVASLTCLLVSVAGIPGADAGQPPTPIDQFIDCRDSFWFVACNPDVPQWDCEDWPPNFRFCYSDPEPNMFVRVTPAPPMPEYFFPVGPDGPECIQRTPDTIECRQA